MVGMQAATMIGCHGRLADQGLIECAVGLSSFSLFFVVLNNWFVSRLIRLHSALLSSLLLAKVQNLLKEPNVSSKLPW
jgi:hypothetical protein